MTPIEIMALLLVVLGIVKLLFMFIHPKSWLRVAQIAFINSVLTTIVAVVVAGVTLFYLLQELTIVQIFASIWFTMMLVVIGIAPFSAELRGWAEKLLQKKNIIRKSCLSMVIWIVLTGGG